MRTPLNFRGRSGRNGLADRSPKGGLDHVRCSKCHQTLDFEIGVNGYVFEVCTQCKTRVLLRGVSSKQGG